MSSVTSNGKKKCPLLTKKGKPCRAAPTEGGLCFFHANPTKAAELGRIGGQKNRHLPVVDVPDLPKLDSIAGIRDTLAQTMRQLNGGQISTKTASVMGQLAGNLMRAIQVADIDAQLGRVDEKLNYVIGVVQKRGLQA